MRKLMKAFDDPWQVLIHFQWLLETHGVFDKWKDEDYLRLIYWVNFRKKLDLKHPKTFNEKLQWLKLNDHKKEYINMVDKYEVKKYVAKIMSEDYVIPILGVWNTFDEIDFNTLPKQFVLKCTHDSGGLVICKDKFKLIISDAKKIIETSLHTNYYLHGREWPYKQVKPRIIAEEFIEDAEEPSGELVDYKIHCFNGVPKIILVCTDRYSESGLCEDFYDVNWNHLDMRRPKHPNAKKRHPQPVTLKKMLELASILAKEIPFVRIDFYEVQDKLYFGEITFYPASGLAGFIPDRWDYELGEWIKI